MSRLAIDFPNACTREKFAFMRRSDKAVACPNIESKSGYKATPVASADTAAMIASEHYKNGDYQKAYKWAISANNLDAKNEKSWIVCAESANKLGKKEEAVSALENYIRSSQSDTAKNALSKIKNHE